MSDFEKTLKVLDTIRVLGAATRNDVVKYERMGSALVKKIVNQLEETGLLTKCGARLNLYKITPTGNAAITTLLEWEGKLWTPVSKE